MWAVLHKRKLSSSQIILFGFAGVILVGTLLLLLPFATNSGKSASFWDAMFTSTSAVCVTGLIVQDTATYWSWFGQSVILLLIQIGGIGFLTWQDIRQNGIHIQRYRMQPISASDTGC